MLPNNLNLDESEKYKNKFSENRERIRRLFDNKLLKDTIEEFYAVQRKFHQDIHKLVSAFKIGSFLPADRKDDLTEFLAPYRILSKNLFNGATDEAERSIENITSVIHPSNESFTQALTALLNSIANVNIFKKFLQECTKDKDIAVFLKTQLGSELYIHGYIDLPFQNLMRYELFLREIKKILNAGDSLMKSFLTPVNQSLEYLTPEIERINEHREPILLLNKIQRALLALLTDFVHDIGIAEKAKQANVDLELLKPKIEVIHSFIESRKDDIIQKQQTVEQAYEGTLEILRELLSHFNQIPADAGTANTMGNAAYYVASTSYYLLTYPFTMFSQSQPNQKMKSLDALTRLQEVFDELENTIEQTNALRDVYEMRVQDGNKPR